MNFPCDFFFVTFVGEESNFVREYQGIPGKFITIDCFESSFSSLEQQGHIGSDRDGLNKKLVKPCFMLIH